jgi:hypothetical protein
LALNVPLECFAQESAAPSRTAVLLIAQGTPAAQKDAALAAIRSQMVDVPIRIVVQETTIPRGDMRAVIDLAVELSVRNSAIGTFWVDLDHEGDLLLYLTEPQGSRLLVRRIRSPKGAEGAALEELGLITRYAVSALLEGGQIGMQPVPVAPTRPPAPPAAAETGADAPRTIGGEATRKRLRLGAGYSGESWLAELGWQNGVRAFASYELGRDSYVGVSYAWEAPLTFETNRASARLVRHPAELLFGARLPLGPVALAGEIALGLDAQVRSTTSSAQGLSKTPDETVLTVAVSPRVGVTKQALGRAEFFGFIGIDYVVNPTAYVIDSPARERVLGSTRVRPRVDMGVSIALF